MDANVSRLLSEEEEIAIVDRVKKSRKCGQCDNIDELTACTNEELLEDERMVSASFIKSNKLLMEKLAAKKPQIVEPVRIEVNIYNDFIPFDECLNVSICSGNLILELIVNVDETAVDEGTCEPASAVRPRSSTNSDVSWRDLKTFDGRVTLICVCLGRRTKPTNKTRQSLPKQPCSIVSFTTESTVFNTAQMVGKIQLVAFNT
jgi:hypothetical protein